MKNLTFGEAFKYPFNRWKGMLNILWVLLPIFGWFALGGYGVILSLVVSLFVLPIVMVHFMVKQTVQSSFDFQVSKAVFNNLGDYVFVLVKTIGLSIVFVLLMIVLVGIPGNAFTKHIFLADFYRRNVVKK